MNEGKRINMADEVAQGGLTQAAYAGRNRFHDRCRERHIISSFLQALDVTAEAGGTPPTRVESRPKGLGPHDRLPWCAPFHPQSPLPFSIYTLTPRQSHSHHDCEAHPFHHNPCNGSLPLNQGKSTSRVHHTAIWPGYCLVSMTVAGILARPIPGLQC